MYQAIIDDARGRGLSVDMDNSCDNKPWGAYLRIADSSIPAFCKEFFTGVSIPEPSTRVRLEPKILLVAPDAQLSLQYHYRRHEHWVVIEGPVRITLGTDHNDLSEITLQHGEVVRIPQGKWHRLSGCGVWGRVAEIWEHSDPANPSDEEDIVRVQDDYGR